VKHSAKKPGYLVLAVFVLSLAHSVSAYGQKANSVVGVWDLSGGRGDYYIGWDAKYGGWVPSGESGSAKMFQFHEDGTFYSYAFYSTRRRSVWFLNRGKYKVAGNQIFLSKIEGRTIENGVSENWSSDGWGSTSTRKFEFITRESDGKPGLKISDGTTYESGVTKFDNFWYRGPPPVRRP